MIDRFKDSSAGMIILPTLAMIYFAAWLAVTLPIILFDALIYWKITGKSLIGASPVQQSKDYSPERKSNEPAA